MSLKVGVWVILLSDPGAGPARLKGVLGSGNLLICWPDEYDDPLTSCSEVHHPQDAVSMGYFGCTCPAMSVPHCHCSGDAPEPRTADRRYCVYGGIGCNVDHDAIARTSIDTERKVDHLLRTADYR